MTARRWWGRSASDLVSGGHMLHAALSRMIGTRRWRLRLWDGVEHGETDPEFTMVLHSRRALDRLIGALPERGFARAYVEGEIDVEPLERLFDCFAEVSARDVALAVPSLLRAVLALGARPERSRARVEAHLRGRRHTRSRDAAAIHHHYDLPPAFYRLLLGETMAYSCAYFEHAAAGIDTAQRAKFELVCRKLRLRPGERLLDVGCGFGGLVMHAAEHHGVTATGITLSVEQARWAQDACAERGLDGRVSIRAADYRDDLGAPYDAVASIGMVEHVGRARMPGYVQALRRALRPGGRALIHGITTWPEDSGINRMINAFVFPDGQLQEVGAMVSALQSEHLEVRDVESLRDHYVLTAERWLAELAEHRHEAVRLVGPQRTRLWRLYLTGCGAAFRRGDIGVHQILVVRSDHGDSRMPLTRADWFATAPEQSPGAAAAHHPPRRHRSPSSIRR